MGQHSCADDSGLDEVQSVADEQQGIHSSTASMAAADARDLRPVKREKSATEDVGKHEVLAMDGSRKLHEAASSTQRRHRRQATSMDQ